MNSLVDVRALRQRRGWTQQELADQLGTDAVTVSRWERGVSVPRSSAQRRLSELAAIPESVASLVAELGEARAKKVLTRELLLERGPQSKNTFVGDPEQIIHRTFELARQQRALKEQAHAR